MPEPHDRPVHNSDYRYKWWVLTAVASSTFLSTVDGSIVNVALPTFVSELNTTFATVQWVILAYLLTQTTLLLGVGRLGDMRGKRPIFISGILIFTLGSLLCGLAPTIYWLIGLRVVQGVGAAMTLALGMAIVTEAFPASERGKALGFNGTVVSVGIVVGPTLGGLILDALSWQWIFFVNLPVGVLGALLAWRYVPHTEPQRGQRFDFWGAALLWLGLLVLLLALTWGQQAGFTAPHILALGATAVLFLALFLVVEWRTRQPMVDLRLFGNVVFSINLLMGLLAFVVIAGTTLLLPFYLEGMLGYAPRQVGLLLALIPIFLGIVAPLAGGLSDRVGTRPISMLGLLIAIAGYGVMSTFNTETGLLVYAIGVMSLGLGMGFFQSPNNSAIMGAAPPKRLGVASGLLAISRALGQITGIATLGALWAGRVAWHAGVMPADGATAAPIPAQVAGLNDTFRVMGALLGVALLLNLAGLLYERRRITAAARTEAPRV